MCFRLLLLLLLLLVALLPDMLAAALPDPDREPAGDLVLVLMLLLLGLTVALSCCRTGDGGWPAPSVCSLAMRLSMVPVMRAAAAPSTPTASC
jgi:hypothetical protein